MSGLVAMIDPPRPEVKDAVATSNSAGIRPMMITGDHPLTARYIANDLGIPADAGLITGQELDALSEEELDEVVRRISVYARVSPEHKLEIVQSLQKQGDIVAMTGDGVNDAPALKRADIGVSMGITGTDVAKEASEMVLQDDNFATIVAAIEEGRTIYDNIRKFIRFLLTCNSGEIWVMLVAPFLGMPLPLLPLQILWMNLVTDGLPGAGVGRGAAGAGHHEAQAVSAFGKRVQSRNGPRHHLDGSVDGHCAVGARVLSLECRGLDLADDGVHVAGAIADGVCVCRTV